MNNIPSLAPRNHFPALEKYIYLNTAANSLIPLPVFEAKTAFEKRTQLGGSITINAAREEALSQTKNEIGQLIKTKPQNIALIHNAGEGTGQLLWGVMPKANQKIIVFDSEFPSIRFAINRIAQQTGCEVCLIPAISENKRFAISEIEKQIDHRTKIIFVSHVQYSNGSRLAIKDLSKIAKANNILLFVDATQSLGLCPIDVEAWDIDALVSSSFKWLCSSTGTAVLYTTEKLRKEIVPPLAGWHSAKDQYNLDTNKLELATSGQRFEHGTLSQVSAYALGQAIKYLQKIGITNIFEHSLTLAHQFQKGLLALGAEVSTPENDEQRAGIITATFPSINTAHLFKLLQEKKLIASYRLGAIRFSFHYYNNSHDLANALTILENVLTTHKS